MIKIGEGEKIQWKKGLTVAEAIKDRPDEKYIAVVRLNGKIVSRPHFESTFVRDRSTIIPIPMIAGG